MRVSGACCDGIYVDDDSVCAAVFPTGVAPGPDPGDGSTVGSRETHSESTIAGDGASRRTSISALSPRAEPYCA